MFIIIVSNLLLSRNKLSLSQINVISEVIITKEINIITVIISYSLVLTDRTIYIQAFTHKLSN